MKSNISSKILWEIKSKNIKPKPKIYFILWNVLFWWFYILSIIIWSTWLGIIFGFIFIDDFLLIQKVWFLFLLEKYIPIFWVIFLFLSIIFWIIFFKKTDNWYKYQILKVIFLNILLTFIWWALLFFSWIWNHFDNSLRKYFYTYNSFFVQNKEKRMIEVWQNENNWLLLWEIISIWNSNVKLKDTQNKIWRIDISTAEIKKKVNIKTWNKIKIIWEKINENNFKALQIRPYFGMNY